MSRPVIGMLWIGGRLSFLEQLCVQSFLDAGHDVRFYTYGDVDNVPEGVQLMDARDILPAEPFLRYERNGSLALHADLFRVRMLESSADIIWADTDAYCLRPWQARDGHYYAFQDGETVASGVIGLPQDSPTLRGLSDFMSDLHPIPGWFRPAARRRLAEARDAGQPVHVSQMPWGVWGPAAVTHFLKETGEIDKALPPRVLYPVPFHKRGAMLAPGRVDPDALSEDTTSIHFYGSRMRRMLSRRHGGIPPKDSLIDRLMQRHGIRAEDAPLPVETPAAPPEPALRPVAVSNPASNQEKVIAVTCMKDEGAFMLEWIAYHQAIGFDHFLIFTNDCSDGTDLMVKRLEELGIATHRDNTRKPHQRKSYQIRAFLRTLREDIYRAHDWAMIMDVDEFLNVHTGDQDVRSLLRANPGADAVSLTWRLFGNGGNDTFDGGFTTENFRQAAPLWCRKPAQAWGMKTLFRPRAFDRLGAHRPLIAKDGNWDAVTWVNGSGQPMPERYRDLTSGNWRSNADSVGYDLAQVNHYAVRSRQSFLLKFIKGTVHGGIDRNLDYWQRMNRNEEYDFSIEPKLAAMRDRHARLLGDPELARLSEQAVEWHRQRIAQALANPEIAAMYDQLAEEVTGPLPSMKQRTAG